MKIDNHILDNLSEWMRLREDIPDGWIYLGDDVERYLIGQPGIRNVLVFGVNPSTAKPGDENIDATIRKVKKLSLEAEYDGWIMVNLYPLRATDPANLPEEADEHLIKTNRIVLKMIVKTYPISSVWAAWGNAIDSRFYLGKELLDIQKELTGDFQWYYRGPLTKRGNPRHPLYMKPGEPFTWFPVADYACAWFDM